MEKSQNKIKNWLSKGYHLVLYHRNSFDLIKKYSFTRFGLILLNFVIFLIFFAIIGVLIVFTPLKEFVPGYPDKETKTLIYENAIRTDSLIIELEKREQYLSFLRDALFNEVPIDEDHIPPLKDLTDEQVIRFNDPRSLKNDELKKKVTQVNLTTKTLPQFFIPLKGVVTSTFNPIINHYGTDIVGTHEDIICSALNGTVIIANYTIETGYTILIQHQDNIITVYRHASKLLVKSGEYVKKGQAIGFYGNTGEYSSGKHLHFEIWRDGQALNPETYINFL